MLMALSLVLVSCSPNANKTDDESSKQTEPLNEAKTAFLKSQYKDLITSVKEIEDMSDKSSKNYSENLSFTMSGEDSITLIDETDASSYNEGKKYEEKVRSLTAEVSEGDNSTSGNTVDESKKVSSTKYEYITFEVNYKNTTEEGKTELALETKNLKFKETGDGKTEQVGSNKIATDTLNYNETSVYKEIFALLKLYCPETGSFTLDQNAIEAILKIVKQSPVIEIKKDFGITDDKRAVITANVSVSYDDDDSDILIKLESAEVSIVETNNDSSTTKTICIISTPEESEMTLVLEDGFSLGFKIARTDDSFAIEIDEDYIKGRAHVSFSDLHVDALWKVEGGAASYSFAVTGNVSYDFTEGELKMAATVKENSKSFFPIEAMISFEGNLKTAEENGDWATFLKGFKIKSFKLGNYDIDPDSMMDLLSTYSNKIITVLKGLFEGTDDETDDTQKADEETKKTDSNL